MNVGVRSAFWQNECAKGRVARGTEGGGRSKSEGSNKRRSFLDDGDDALIWRGNGWRWEYLTSTDVHTTV